MQTMTTPAVKLSSNYLIVLLMSLILLAGCSADEDSVIRKEDLRTELLAAVNELRADGCLCANDYMPPVQALTWNDTLQKAADNHARDMYTNRYFSHLSQDGTPPIGRAMKVGYHGEYVGENIARGYQYIPDVMQAWRESESHCKAMMDTLYNEMGASEVGGYWVLDLGRTK
jgi:uncharacterized protein YkwD